eukprot:s274_g7.t1
MKGVILLIFLFLSHFASPGALEAAGSLHPQLGWKPWPGPGPQRLPEMEVVQTPKHGHEKDGAEDLESEIQEPRARCVPTASSRTRGH